MQLHRHRERRVLRGLLLAAALAFPAAAFAGPPLLCDPFDTGGAASLPWGDDWNRVDRGYDTTRLPADTLRLLDARVPVIARMETLRRAAIYASASGELAHELVARLDARILAAEHPQARAAALFDAGYFSETVQDIVRLQGYDMPGIGKVDVPALTRILAAGDGSLRIARALQLEPEDASMRFASALVAKADQRTGDYAMHARQARAGARDDRLLAGNLARIAD